jgi:hypothetical protein
MIFHPLVETAGITSRELLHAEIGRCTARRARVRLAKIATDAVAPRFGNTTHESAKIGLSCKQQEVYRDFFSRKLSRQNHGQDTNRCSPASI